MTQSIEPATDEAVKPISDASLARVREAVQAAKDDHDYDVAQADEGERTDDWTIEVMLEAWQIDAILSRLTQAERERDEARATLTKIADGTWNNDRACLNARTAREFARAALQAPQP